MWRSSMTHIGFVGLGAMGSRVTKRLLDAGYSVTGYNRTRSKAQWLIDAGLRWGESPRAVAEAADVVFTMGTNTTALEAVVEGPAGILATLGTRDGDVGPAGHRDRLHVVEVADAVHPQRAGRGLVRRQHDAEGPEPGARNGQTARRLAPHRGGEQRIPDGGARAGPRRARLLHRL